MARSASSVWPKPSDKGEIRIGDNLVRKIDDGLRRSRYGVVIVSPHFFAKGWSTWELSALAAIEAGAGKKRILPVWHNMTSADVEKHSPLMAVIYAANTNDGIESIADQIAELPRACLRSLTWRWHLEPAQTPEDNLRLGSTVIADCVNPVPFTRKAWLDVAKAAGVVAVEVEIICSDATEHRRRIETGTVPGGVVGRPRWKQVARNYRARDQQHVVIDTAHHSVEEAVALLRRAVGASVADLPSPRRSKKQMFDELRTSGPERPSIRGESGCYIEGDC